MTAEEHGPGQRSVLHKGVVPQSIATPLPVQEPLEGVVMEVGEGGFGDAGEGMLRGGIYGEPRPVGQTGEVT